MGASTRSSPPVIRRPISAFQPNREARGVFVQCWWPAEGLNNAGSRPHGSPLPNPLIVPQTVPSAAPADPARCFRSPQTAAVISAHRRLLAYSQRRTTADSDAVSTRAPALDQIPLRKIQRPIRARRPSLLARLCKCPIKIFDQVVLPRKNPAQCNIVTA